MDDVRWWNTLKFNIMAVELCYPNSAKYVLCYNVAGENPYGYGYVSTGNCMKSGLDVLEQFDIEHELKNRMDELGYEYDEIMI